MSGRDTQPDMRQCLECGYWHPVSEACRCALMNVAFRTPQNLSDPVNRPSHYQGDIECIDAIRAALGEDGFLAFCRGNAIKYAWRAGKKGATGQDMAKAAWYSRMASGDDPRKE